MRREATGQQNRVPQLLTPSAGRHPGLRGGFRPEAAVPAIVIGSHVEERFSRGWELGVLMPLSIRGGGLRLNADDRSEINEVTGFPDAADAPANHAVGERSGYGIPLDKRPAGATLN